MKSNRAPFFIAVIAFVLVTLACGASFSSANISDAWMATDESGDTRVATYSAEAVFFAMVQLNNAPDDTTLKAVWMVVEAEEIEPNFVINETEFTSSDGLVHFQLENKEYLWPVGQYKVEIYLNDSLDKTLTFEVR
jgi:hypothetical protein